MPWGYECKANFVKQLPAKPTEKRGLVAAAINSPGPNNYETPELFCNYTFSSNNTLKLYFFLFLLYNFISTGLVTFFDPRYPLIKLKYPLKYCANEE